MNLAGEEGVISSSIGSVKEVSQPKHHLFFLIITRVDYFISSMVDLLRIILDISSLILLSSICYYILYQKIELSVRML
jgi:hypothetical protein